MLILLQVITRALLDIIPSIHLVICSINFPLNPFDSFSSKSQFLVLTQRESVSGRASEVHVATVSLLLLMNKRQRKQ